jgi:uncharacterized protein (TIGR01777 family)
MKIWIAGGTGLIGKRLSAYLLKEGHEVTILTRKKQNSFKEKSWGNFCEQKFPQSPSKNFNVGGEENIPSILLWDGKSVPVSSPPPEAIVNLCGAGIADARWSAERKRVLLESRIHPILAFEKYLQKIPVKPKVFLQASAVGFYGTSLENKDITEEAPNGDDFLSKLCLQWESATQSIASMGIRTVFARTGVVLDPEGGALAKILPPFRFFLGGPLGHGKQWFPWIHRDDEAEALTFLLQNEKAAGPFNLCAPGIVNNREFSKTLAQILHRPCFIPAPAWVLKILFGELSLCILEGQKAVPKKILELGYVFRHQNIHDALRAPLKIL